MTDQDTTQVMPPADPPPEPQPEGTKRLLRSRSDRMLGGVAGGLADYFRVDPVIFRIGFGVTLFFGGLGALIYLAMMIFVPSEPGDGTQVSSAPRTFGRVVLLTLVAIAGLIGLAIMGVGAAWAAATGHGVLVAITRDRDRGGPRGRRLQRRRPLADPARARAGRPARHRRRGGHRVRGRHRQDHPHPADGPRDPRATAMSSASATSGSTCATSTGSKDRVIEVEADQGIGRMLVLVPEDVCVDGHIDSRYGIVEIAGEESSESLPSGYSATPRLELDASLDAGKIEVVNDDDVGYGDHFGGNDGIARDELRDRMEAACAAEPAKGGRDG